MTWHKLEARTVIGDPNNPLVIALHGFAQRIRTHRTWRWGNWRYWDFAEMSQLLTECEMRDWSCWMPQAPQRNWRPEHADGWRDMVRAAQDATGCRQEPIVCGFSDGATIVNYLIAAAVDVGACVSWSGMVPGNAVIEAYSETPVMLIRNSDEKERIQQQVKEFERRLLRRLRTVKVRVCQGNEQFRAGHNWNSDENGAILDWAQEAMR